MIGWTLGRYFSARFLAMILAVFATICGMVFVVDFVEMLRRTSNIADASTGAVAALALLRAPAASEQLMPFCVLFGSMAAFLDLTRKLELLIARAVGVSVWGFLVPPVAIALIIGIGSVALLNPASALMKQRADKLETEIFGQLTRRDAATEVWIRQKSVDGDVIIRAKSMSGDGRRLVEPVAYVYDHAGRFEEQVEAANATLEDGVWRFDGARIFAPGEETFTSAIYFVATNLTPAQVVRGPVSPQSVPFWDLEAERRRTETAGLDATGFDLQFQSLLARPLLFVAMVLISAAFSLRFFRFGGIGKMVGGGVAAGFVLYVATKLVGDIGGAGLISAPVAAWSPALIASLLGALALLNQEDG
ncbi:LPS export ABC transporter permease LptG [Methylocella sp.]|uniref:LPS export ABC transporter permease LptG n=1 Tax=Methylocella sp. TaxID=1978226 RepID=UPI00378455F0